MGGVELYDSALEVVVLALGEPFAIALTEISGTLLSNKNAARIAVPVCWKTFDDDSLFFSRTINDFQVKRATIGSA